MGERQDQDQTTASSSSSSSSQQLPTIQSPYTHLRPALHAAFCRRPSRNSRNITTTAACLAAAAGANDADKPGLSCSSFHHHIELPIQPQAALYRWPSTPPKHTDYTTLHAYLHTLPYLHYATLHTLHLRDAAGVLLPQSVQCLLACRRRRRRCVRGPSCFSSVWARAKQPFVRSLFISATRTPP